MHISSSCLTDFMNLFSIIILKAYLYPLASMVLVLFIFLRLLILGWMVTIICKFGILKVIKHMGLSPGHDPFSTMDLLSLPLCQPERAQKQWSKSKLSYNFKEIYVAFLSPHFLGHRGLLPELSLSFTLKLTRSLWKTQFVAPEFQWTPRLAQRV